MKTTEAVTSGVSSSRLTGWRPAWEGWSAAAGFAAAGTTAAMVPGWWGAGLASVLALMGVVRTAEALRTASRRIPLAGFAPAFIHAGDLIRILREKGMDEKKAVDPARKTARERLVAATKRAGLRFSTRCASMQAAKAGSSRTSGSAADSSGLPHTPRRSMNLPPRPSSP